jgi:hypothetical protein
MLVRQLIQFVLISFAGMFCSAAETNSLRPWNDYRTIMWIGDSAYKQPEKLPLFFQRLREMGVNTASLHGDSDFRPLLANDFPYYVENMVTRGLCLKFNSKVTDWDKFVTQWARTGRPDSALVRDYSLDDPQWQAWARKTMQALVRKNMTNAPLAYDIRDELSVTYSANPFDYDFSPATLEKFREWLKTQYRDVRALNEEWQTTFASWDDVKPFTTDEIKNRMASGEASPRGKPDWQALQRLKFNLSGTTNQLTRWNFSPWCDFRTYMDLSLARTLDDLRRAAHDRDPRTPVGIEGTQMPSAFGGYDLWRLSQALDWVEPYDIGDAREIFGSFMPGKPIITTVFEKDTEHASRRLWHLLLEGDRGCIVWWSEDCIDWKSADYALTPKAKALAPVLKEMTSPLAQIFLRAERERDPVYILYSQPSIQVNWLLESTRDGSTWLRRFSSFEAEHNVMAKERNGWIKLFQDAGYSPQFIASDKLRELGARTRTGVPANTNKPVLVLSEALALSTEQARFIAGSVRAERIDVFFDSPAGVFDEHGRLRSSRNPLALLGDARGIGLMRSVMNPQGSLFAAFTITNDMESIARARFSDENEKLTRVVQHHISVKRPVSVPLETHTRIHRFKLGGARLIGFERNVNYHMSEDLKQAGGNEALEMPVAINATLAERGHVYDLRSGKYIGNTDTISFTLDPWKPSLFAVTREKLETPDIVAALLARVDANQ